MDLCDLFAAELMAEHAAACAGEGRSAGPFLSRLGEVFKHLRSLNIPWSAIAAKAQSVLAVVAGGGDWQAVLAAVVALFPKSVPSA